MTDSVNPASATKHATILAATLAFGSLALPAASAHAISSVASADARRAAVHHTVVGRDRQSDEFQFGSKNRSAETNAATEVLVTASCLGASHEDNLGAGAVPVGSSL